MTDVTKNSRLFAGTSTTCSTLLLAVCVCLEQRFTPIDIQHIQCLCRFVILETRSSIVTSFETGIYTSQLQQGTRYIRASSRMWRLGCFPEAWRRRSCHFQVASSHLQSMMNPCPLHTIFIFSFLSKRSKRRMPPAERSALYI